MDQHDIEQIIGRLYLVILDKDRQIAELKAQLPAPSPMRIIPREEPSAG